MATVRINSGGEPERKNELTPVVSSNNVTVKKSLGKKFADAFISDAAADVGGYIGKIVVDTIKETIVNVISMILLGDSTSASLARQRKNRLSGENTRYRAFYQSEMDDLGAPPRRYNPAPITDYRSIVINNQPGYPEYARATAEKIVETLRGRIEKYDQASVADLLELCDLPTARDGVDRNMGWTRADYRDIGKVRVNGGYLIVVPDAKELPYV
ncbi:MAG: hypothetical protein J6Y02_23910 [Pseudobutyrivibrio sp.]|nr:hypothetical protein [Pseudobutyrivibrio sp.]